MNTMELTRPELMKLQDGSEILIKWWNREKPHYYYLKKLYGAPWAVPVKVTTGTSVVLIPIDITSITINDVIKRTSVMLSNRPFVRVSSDIDSVLIKTNETR